MSPAAQALPHYLRKYVAEQHYEKYTPEDHAAWRYIMRQNRAFFSQHAVPVYREGLQRTGVTLDRIPRIAEMDALLAEFGWGAAPVIGFIPPAAFLEFQARRVLAIACDMRTISHIAYTPAPDIVHEAAGHAPIVADPQYADYLCRYARMAQKAIQSIDDIRIYEAIRYLSDIKENPDTKPEAIAAAELRLKTVSESVKTISEAVKVARMAWWTVEYGLVETADGPKIYGAGLLSSVGESQACLSHDVKKIPLSVNCVETSYNITEPQPQLFVARSMDHLTHVLSDLEKTLSFVVGAESGLAKAKEAGTVTTTVLNSGVATSGILTEYRKGAFVNFVKFSGPVQIAYGETQLEGHGRERHGQGFSSPIGRWKKFPDKKPHELTDAELAQVGLKPGARAKLELVSGFVVEGIFAGATRKKNHLVLLTWKDCRVTLGNEVLYQPEWGEFDQLVGDVVDSVYGGPADSYQYGEWNMGEATTVPSRTSPFSEKELSLHEVYRKTRMYREKGVDEARLEEMNKTLVEKFPDEWLPVLELYEIAAQKKSPQTASLRDHLEKYATKADPGVRDLVKKGLALATTHD